MTPEDKTQYLLNTLQELAEMHGNDVMFNACFSFVFGSIEQSYIAQPLNKVYEAIDSTCQTLKDNVRKGRKNAN